VSCTGLEGDRHADWPALTTDAPPVSGPGVDPWLLGSVYRSDLGTYQVTYAGHPVYLFDPGPNSYRGANFYETVLPLPPWHTAWYLMNRDGLPATGQATVETEAPQAGTTYSTPKLAVEMLPGIVPGGVAVSAYKYGRDTSTASHCYAGCQRFMIPVYTVGAPIIGSGVNASEVGTITRPNGTLQVTYNGHPLYIYSAEQLLAGGSGPSTTGTAGNGEGATFDAGTFRLLNP
jgi:predicted lipoprotein with Yx(FWY)xxD motif